MAVAYPDALGLAVVLIMYFLMVLANTAGFSYSCWNEPAPNDAADRFAVLSLLALAISVVLVGYVVYGAFCVMFLGRPIHPETLTMAFRSAAERAGVPRVRLHDLRHTHATLLLADGVPAKVVQERLGHSSISITLDLYGHVTAELEQHAADRIEAIVKAPGV